MALAKVHKIYNKVQIPIIGMGGISSYKDVVEFIRIGSSMVQVGTLNYRSPSIISTFNADLKKFLIDNGIGHISELIGCYIDV
jgi:dihydroorotate dehydrogenase (NAD+) catalytic subunit